MEKINIIEINSRINFLSKDLKTNYWELLDIYKKIVTYYYYNKT